MKILKAFQFRLKPSAAQDQVLRKYMGCARFTYNRALALQKELYEKEQRKLSYPEMARQLVVWKRDDETSFLKEAPAQILQQKLMDLEKSYTNFFKRGAGFPKFKKRGRRETFRLPDAHQITLDQKNERVQLPKIGWLRYRHSRDIIGTIKNVTISFEAGEWHISFQVEQEIETPIHPSNEMVGIDLGIAQFATLSNGDHISALNSLKNHASSLKRCQKKLSRKKKGSQNWKKHCKKLARKHKKIRNCRKDFLHKASTMLSKNQALIVVENLKIGNMSRSARGTGQEPGRNVRAKSGLNRSILDQGWGEFLRQL
ncbi:MAG: hypothetical protein B7X85_07290, partial [Thiotrichales bacterium 17-46-47]